MPMKPTLIHVTYTSPFFSVEERNEYLESFSYSTLGKFQEELYYYVFLSLIIQRYSYFFLA